MQNAIDDLGFDCKIDAFYLPFHRSGFVPCVLSGSATGFELYFQSSAEVLLDFPHLAAMVGSLDVALTFRWVGDISEFACVIIVCAALAKSFGAIVHYHDDDLLYSANQLVMEALALIP